jgi:predicted nucleic acid-binding protein
MFANRYTALIDACSLADTLRRNLLLTLAEAEFFRVRWSVQILDETERAIARMATDKGLDDPASRAERARDAMTRAFPEADVGDFTPLMSAAAGLRDTNDHHVLAAALKTQAQTIVTENLRDFPAETLSPFGIEARSADDFIADTVALDIGRAVPAIRAMRLRLKRPAIDGERLLLDMEARGLTATSDVLATYVASF